MNDRMESRGSVRGIDASKRRVTAVVATGDVARDGAIIDPSGWDLRQYAKNAVVLWAHNDRELPIAKTLESRIEPNALVQVHEFATHTRAEEVWQLVKGGFVNATSVRWNAIETTQRRVGNRDVLVFTKAELLETSYVPVPADPGAVVVRADGKPFDPATFRTGPVPATRRDPRAFAVAFLQGFNAAPASPVRASVAAGVGSPRCWYRFVVPDFDLPSLVAREAHFAGVREPKVAWAVRCCEEKAGDFWSTEPVAGVHFRAQGLIAIDATYINDRVHLVHVVAHEVFHTRPRTTAAPVDAEREAERWARQRCAEASRELAALPGWSPQPCLLCKGDIEETARRSAAGETRVREGIRI